MNSNASATLAPSANLTQAEQEQAHTYFQQTQDAIVGATCGLTAAQWNFKTSPARWSIAEILEHVVFVQERVLGPIAEQLDTAPAPPPETRETVDSIVLGQFPQRLKRFTAPDFAQPTGRWTPDEALERLAVNYVRLRQLVDSTPGLRAHALEAPPLKAVSSGVHQLMDGYQWLLTAAAHTDRHTKQILEVKAHPGFPSH